MKITPSPRAKVQPLPQLILAGRILQLGSADLERAVLRELEENPALELAEEDSISWSEGTSANAQEEEEDRETLEQAAAEIPLEEYLLQQMMPHLQPGQATVAQIVVESLDSHGLLSTSIEELTQQASARPQEVEEVLAILQQQEPRGIGARSVQECLLLQLGQLAEEGQEYRPAQLLAQSLIAEHWEELGKASFSRLASSVGATVEEIQEALDFIRHNLTPFPAHAYSSTAEVNFVRPDVILRLPPERGEMTIEFPEEGRYRLRINPLYQELAAAGEEGISEKEREHLRASTESARLFISSLEQRWQTLRRMMEELLAEQSDFFVHGPRHLKPLTRAQLAQSLGVHESTVSRAVADKYLQLPSGRVVALGDLFDGSLAIKDRIQEIVSQEKTPLSDAQIASRLREQGIRIARRTVAKYREALGILPATLRRPRPAKTGAS